MTEFTLSMQVDSSEFARFGGGLRRVAANLTPAMRRGTERVTVKLYHEAFDLIPKRSNRTASTIQWEVEPTASGAKGYVGSNDRVASFLEFGTRSHDIKPSQQRMSEWQARYDAWSSEGKPKGSYPHRPGISVGGGVVAHAVHPGTREYAWLLRAGVSTEREVGGTYQSEVIDTFDRYLRRGV